MSGGNDKVIAFSHTVYDASGNATERHTFEIHHDDTNGLDLDSTTAANSDYVRRSVYSWYDAADRLDTMADYGSGDPNGTERWQYTAVPARPTTAPTTSSADHLVTQYAYNSSTGRLETVTDPMDIDTTTAYDDLGRRLSVTEDDGGADQRETSFTYNGLGQIVTLTAENSETGDQVTTYLYEDAVDAARQTNTIYSDSSDTTSSGTDQVKISYNVDGSIDTRTDQRGVEITYRYNDRRQTIYQDVTDFASSAADQTVQSIGRAYDSLGRVETITSYDDVSTGSPDEVNEVKFTYNTQGQLSNSAQDHTDDVATGSEHEDVGYAYDNTADGADVFTNGARLEDLTYPNGRVLHNDYGTAGGVDDLLGRVQNLYETDTNGTHYVAYAYNGVGRTAVVDTIQPGIHWHSDQNNDGKYGVWDRFGRVIIQFWKPNNVGWTGQLVNINYGYDYAGDRTWREDVVAASNSKSHDELYTYDRLRRLTGAQRGNLNSGKTAVTSKNFAQDWTLDETGNWTAFDEDDDGAGWDLQQTRSHNDANEIDTDNTHGDADNPIGQGGGQAAWTQPVYDAAGNLTTMPRPDTPTSGYTATYDAWNRLVKLEDSSAAVAEYEYDGLNRRIVATPYSGGSPGDPRHFYYSNRWQVLEERIDSSEDADRQFVWGVRYIDDLILRDRDSDANGSLDERLYALTDALYNVVALINTSGSVQERFLYDPYGKSKVLTPGFADRASSSYDWEYRFTGRRLDLDTGLQLNRNRYYHNALGRWINRDPIGYAGGINLYEYERGYSIGFVDPFGLQPPPVSYPLPHIFPSLNDYAINECWTACLSRSNIGNVLTPTSKVGKAANTCRNFGWEKATNVDGTKGADGRPNSKHVSLRHCMAAACLARKVGCGCASCLGHAREQYQYYLHLRGAPEGGNRLGESRRGDYRNQIGLSVVGCVGDQGKEDPICGTDVHVIGEFYCTTVRRCRPSPTDQDIIDLCKKAWDDGKLDAFKDGIDLPEMNDTIPIWHFDAPILH